MSEPTITGDGTGEKLPELDGGVILGSQIGRIRFFQPTSALCIKDGQVLQLWSEYHDPRNGEWRPLLSFDEAQRQYGGVLADS